MSRVGSGQVILFQYHSGRVRKFWNLADPVESGRVKRLKKLAGRGHFAGRVGSGRVGSGRVGGGRVGSGGLEVSRIGSGHDPRDTGHSRVKPP